MTEPSSMEMLYAIFVNVLEVDDDGNLLNERHAERRVAQWLKSYIDRDFKLAPPLEPWEGTLYCAIKAPAGFRRGLPNRGDATPACCAAGRKPHELSPFFLPFRRRVLG